MRSIRYCEITDSWNKISWEIWPESHIICMRYIIPEFAESGESYALQETSCTTSTEHCHLLVENTGTYSKLPNDMRISSGLALGSPWEGCWI